MNPSDLNRLIKKDRVHRSVYTDKKIFGLEMERIHNRTWIYLGHDSQIAKSGDYFSARLGTEPVIVVRQANDNIRVMQNRCQHKGMQLVADNSSGNAKRFRCGYHGWTYKNDGALHVIPAPAGYKDTKVCRGAEDLALTRVADVEVYRGFIFARLKKGNGVDFETWLGPMRSSLDNFVDRSPDGKVVVDGGVFRYVHYANWKFFTENTLDALHPMVVHQSATQPADRMASERKSAGLPEEFAYELILPFKAPYDFFDEMGQRGTPFGHGELGNKGSIHSGYDQFPEYWKRMVESYGEERAKEILDISRNNSLLYPSIMFKAPVSLLRVIRPVSVNETIIETWHFRLVGAPEEVFERNIQYSSVVNSAAGMVGPDDHAVYQRLQSGLQAQNSDWVMMSRHMNQETEDDEDSHATVGTSDFVFRNQFAAWQQYMGHS